MLGSGRGRFALVAVLGVLVLAAFSPALSSGLVYEDAHWRDAVRRGDAVWTRPTRMLTTLTYSLQHQAGHNVAQFHAVNIVLHAANGGLVFVLACALGLSWEIGWLAAVLFLLHPIQTEAVAYVNGRGDLLSTGMILAAVIAAVKARYRSHAVTVALLGMLAIACKESGVAVVLLLWMAALLLSRRAAWPAAALSIVALTGTPFLLAINRQAGLEPFGWAAGQITAWWNMLWLTVRLDGFTVDHDIDVVSTTLRHLAVVGFVSLGALLWFLRRSPVVLFVAAWPLVVTLPRLIVQTPSSFLNEHQFYLAMVGVSVTLSVMINHGLSWLASAWSGAGGPPLRYA